MRTLNEHKINPGNDTLTITVLDEPGHGNANHAYDIEEGRAWWKVRLLSLGLTLGLAAFILIAFALVLVGPTAAEYIARVTGLGPAFAWTWKILQWPLVVALVSFGAGLVYYFAPDAEQEWVWVTPGAILAAIIWLAASLGFKFYVANFATYTETYGAIGGVILTLLVGFIRNYTQKA